MRKIIFAMGLLLSMSAGAFPKHIFYCGLTDLTPMLQVYFEIEENQVKDQTGVIKISRFVDDKWEVRESAQVRAEINWEKENDVAVIKGIKVDMGRSGMLEAYATGSYEQDTTTKGFIRANLMSLNYPNGIEANYCTYFLILGTRPGMTGSN
jgi:hypothetical protein